MENNEKIPSFATEEDITSTEFDAMDDYKAAESEMPEPVISETETYSVAVDAVPAMVFSEDSLGAADEETEDETLGPEQLENESDTAPENGQPSRITRRQYAEMRRARAINREKSEVAAAETEKRRVQESALESIRRSRQLLNGKVVGVDDIPINGETIVCAGVMLANKVKVEIRYDDMYSDQILDMSTVDLSTTAGRRLFSARQRQILAKTIGSNIALQITQIVDNFDGQGHQLIFASRELALARLRAINFGRTPRAVEGEIYEATILSVNPNSLAATFCGCDFVLRKYELTNRYLNDLSSYYKSGAKLRFRLEKINRTANGSVTLDVNPKAAELIEARERHYQISVNTLANGIIVRVGRQGNRLSILTWLPDYEQAVQIAYMNANDFGQEPVTGDSVSILITGFRDNGYLQGRIRSLNGNAGMFASLSY